MKSGFVSIVGRPNVGKSTLLNTIIGEKVAIISDKAGTTRNVIQGIYNEDSYQIVFVDTPGIGRGDNRLNRMLNKEASALTKDVDVVLFVYDAASGFGKNDAKILSMLSNEDVPVICVINKIDKLKTDDIMACIAEVKDLYSFAEIVPLSGLKNDNVDRLVSCIKKYLTDTIKYFLDDEFTTQSSSFMASELVREKILQKTCEEVPHAVTCYTTSFVNKKDIVEICIDIVVDRDSLKKIIIGKKGEMLKNVGTEARVELERLFDKKVFLDTYVKTVKNWKDKEKYLKELGFDGYNE